MSLTPITRVAAALVTAVGLTGAAVAVAPGPAHASAASPELPSNCWEAGWYDQVVNGIAGFCHNVHTGYVDWYGFNGEYGTSWQHQ